MGEEPWQQAGPRKRRGQQGDDEWQRRLRQALDSERRPSGDRSTSRHDACKDLRARERRLAHMPSEGAKRLSEWCCSASRS